MSKASRPDYLTRYGAGTLAKTIKAYWRKRGHDVTLEIYEIDGMPGNYGIRSNLVGGKP